MVPGRPTRERARVLRRTLPSLDSFDHPVEEFPFGEGLRQRLLRLYLPRQVTREIIGDQHDRDASFAELSGEARVRTSISRQIDQGDIHVPTWNQACLFRNYLGASKKFTARILQHALQGVAKIPILLHEEDTLAA